MAVGIQEVVMVVAATDHAPPRPLRFKTALGEPAKGKNFFKYLDERMSENNPLEKLQRSRFPALAFSAGRYAVLAILGFAGMFAVLSANALDLAVAPVLDLNGPEMPGLDYATTYTEDEGPLTIVANSLSLTDDGANLYSATISLDDIPDKSKERLSVTADLSGTNIKSTYYSATGILKLTGQSTVQNYETVLRTVTYKNESQAPDTTDRIVTFVVNDGSSYSESVSSTVAIFAVNDAPILDNSGDLRLNPIVEDDQSQIGNLVSTILASDGSVPDPITDPDDPEGTDPEGIAVIEVGDSNGTWEYSIDSGSTWSAFGTVNNNSAVLLDETSRIRFVPKANYNGIASFIFRAWDQTTKEKSGERADSAINGGISAFSTATESVTIDVTAVNDRPVVDLNGQLPGEEYAASFLSKNEPVSLTTPDAFVFDVESSELVSLTITLTNRPDGSAESITVIQPRGGIKIIPYDPATGILKLEGPASLENFSAMLRDLRYLNEAQNMNVDARTIEFKANDGTDDSLLRTTTLVSVLSNVAPVLDPAASMRFSGINEDELNPVGDSVSALLATAGSDPITDADPGSQRGFAVIGAENLDGVWQFSIDGGTTWIAVGEVSDTAAVLLNDQAKIRFLPDPNFSGEARSITVRAWDQSEGSNGLSSVDVSNNGGITAFSVSTSSIPIQIKPINDPPVLTITENTIAQYIEGMDPVIVAGPAIQIVDVDSNMLQSATISIDNMIANELDVLGAATNGSAITATYDDNTGRLRLAGRGSLAEYQSILRSVTFVNKSEDPAVEDRIISFEVNDGVDPSNAVTSLVRVEAINNPPSLDLNGMDLTGVNNFVYYDNDGTQGSGPLVLASKLEIQDVDNTTLIKATVRIKNRPDGLSESLTIDTEGTTISAVYLDNGRQINLSGQGSLADYQKVLRTAVYSNNHPKPNRAVRDITFTIEDASSGVTTEISHVVVRPQIVFFPVIPKNVSQQIVEEPNDTCEEAVAIATNVSYEFMADDVYDWFSFALAKTTTTTVELSEFKPEKGQILVAKGTCADKTRIGHNGNESKTKIIELGRLEPGRYYILLITDGPKNNQDPYKLRVKVN
jgi:hypothetical protein